MVQKETLITPVARLARVIEHLTYGSVADLLTRHRETAAAVEDYRWCRNELTAIYHQLSSPIPVVEEGHVITVKEPIDGHY